MSRLLWSASQFISQYLYLKTEEEPAELTTEKRTSRDELFESYAKLSRESDSLDEFWKGLAVTLKDLSQVLDATAAAVLSEQDSQASRVASYALQVPLSGYPLNTLATAHATPFEGPLTIYLSSNPASLLCPLCSLAVRSHPSVNSAMIEKARLSDNTTLHISLFLSRHVIACSALTPHLREQILSQFALETINCFTTLERVEQFKETIDQQNMFLKDISHQINQPLHGLVADCDNLLSDDFPIEKKARIIKYLPFRAKHISMLARCVEYAGSMESVRARPDQYSLTRLLIDNAINLQGYADEVGARITVLSDTTDRVGQIEIDKDQFVMAVTNVLYNAVKYSFPDHEVSIKSSIDSVREQIVISVTHFGIEIPSDKWERIFRRGERLAVAKRYCQSGLGIGLFVSRELMRKLGGDITVTESVATGAFHRGFPECRNTFALTLPNALVVGKT